MAAYPHVTTITWATSLVAAEAYLIRTHMLPAPGLTGMSPGRALQRGGTCHPVTPALAASSPRATPPNPAERKFGTYTDLPVEIQGADPAEFAYDTVPRSAPAPPPSPRPSTPGRGGPPYAMRASAARAAGPMSHAAFLTGIPWPPKRPSMGVQGTAGWKYMALTTPCRPARTCSASPRPHAGPRADGHRRRADGAAWRRPPSRLARAGTRARPLKGCQT